MSAENEREGSLPEDLQRCRRLVAAIRGQILAPSRKQQALKQLVVIISHRQETQQNRWWANDAMPSPRERYLRDIQVRRIRTIQKRWRRHMLQKRIMAKLRMEQKWRSRQGITRFRKSALMIQRVFRGHFVRKHKIDIASYLAGLVSRVERLRSDREVFHLKCENIQQELQQIRLDIEIIRDKLSEEEKEVALLANTATIAVAVDATGIHEDAVESVEYYKSEEAELEEFARNLETELRELKEQEPVVHFAATLIQALYRGAWCRTQRLRDRQRQRQVNSRMLQSKDLCYDRIHASWIIRNQKLWDASSRIIAGLFHIQKAKQERVSLRRDRAARRILRLYRDVQARTAAKQSLQWKRVKLHAKELAQRKLRTLLQLTWSGWLRYVQKEAQRRTIIAAREEAGLSRWQNAKVEQFLAAYRARLAKRKQLERKIMNGLDARVLHHIRAVVETSGDSPCTMSAQEISSAFLLLIRSDIWSWQVPDKQLYFLAQRYNLPLELLPLKQIHHWLAEESPSFVDLYAPLPTQTLLVFIPLSQYFALHSRILMQIQRILEVYEAHMLMREYLALMYTANIVRLSPSTTFSSQQRQRAVDILREKDRVEYLPISKDSELESGARLNNQGALVSRGAFTTFHCVWNHRLCERCLAMRPERREVSRQCKCCGHHLYEANTVARDLRLEAQDFIAKREIQPLTPAKIMWASTSERCDFMVLNAFFHTLSPVNHDSRKTYALDTLWKLAIRSAYEPMVELYNQLPTGSLTDFLNASEELETWAKVCCLPNVGGQLQLFITILKDEWTQLDAQLALEAQVAATIFPQGEFYNGDHHNERTKRAPMASMVQRKKVKRPGQPVGHLKPLVNMTPTTQH